MTSPRAESPPPPRATIVTPCYNDGRFVRELAASIIEPEAVDLLVVDDGSTDPESISALKQLEADARARVVWQANTGPAGAIHAGVGAARTPFVFILGADDLMAPGAIHAMADALDSDPSLAIAYGDCIAFGDDVEPDYGRLPAWDPWVMLTGCYTTGCFLIRRDVYLAVIERVSTSLSEDWDILLEVIAAGWGGRHVGRVVFYYRKHAADARRRSTTVGATDTRRLRAKHQALYARWWELWRQSPLPLRAKLRYWAIFLCRCWLPRPAFDLLVRLSASGRGPGPELPEVTAMRESVADARQRAGAAR